MKIDENSVLSILRENALVIILIMFVSIVSGLKISKNVEYTVYSVDTKYLIKQNVENQKQDYDEINASYSKLFSKLSNSSKVFDELSIKYKNDISTEELKSMISFNPDSELPIVSIIVRSNDKEKLINISKDFSEISINNFKNQYPTINVIEFSKDESAVNYNESNRTKNLLLFGTSGIFVSAGFILIRLHYKSSKNKINNL